MQQPASAGRGRPRTPETDRRIVAATRELLPDLGVLSAATHFNRVELRDVVDRLRGELPGVEVLATGYAFSRSTEGWSAEELLDPDGLLGDV